MRYVIVAATLLFVGAGAVACSSAPDPKPVATRTASAGLDSCNPAGYYPCNAGAGSCCGSCDTGQGIPGGVCTNDAYACDDPNSDACIRCQNECGATNSPQRMQNVCCMPIDVQIEQCMGQCYASGQWPLAECGSLLPLCGGGGGGGQCDGSLVSLCSNVGRSNDPASCMCDNGCPTDSCGSVGQACQSGGCGDAEFCYIAADECGS
jgi:hypothetical protein